MPIEILSGLFKRYLLLLDCDFFVMCTYGCFSYTGGKNPEVYCVNAYSSLFALRVVGVWVMNAPALVETGLNAGQTQPLICHN